MSWGMRVVVRRVLPGETGPTGGPAMTDVLGVCESWGDGVATLRRDDGTVVEIATRDIVSGKPVPPRPSARMRVTPREAEGHAAPLWPQVERVALGEWELRTDPAPVDRLRKRANSCLAMGEPDRPFDAAAEAIRSFYASATGRRSPRCSWARPRRRRSSRPAGGWWSRARPSSGWRAWRRPGAGSAEADDAEALSSPRTVRGCGPWSGHATRGRRARRCWLGVHGMVTDPSYRRQGLARRVLAALAEWGAEQGATTLWLHVETDNAPADRALRGSRAADPPRLPLLRGSVSHGVAHTTVSEEP